MGFWQREILRDSVAQTIGQTYELDLPKSGYLMGLLLHFWNQHASDAYIDGGLYRVLDHITKVEVVANGSDVLFSLDGEMIEANQYYDTGIATLDRWITYATAFNRATLYIPFGRGFMDGRMGLDLSKWNRVELKVTNDMTSTYWGTSPGMTVMGYWLRGVGGNPFSGYLRKETFREWTTVSDETKYIELPAKNKLRKIILQGKPDVDSDFEAEAKIYNVLYEVLLTAQAGLVTIFDGKIQELMRDNVLEVGKLPITFWHQYVNSGKGLDAGLGYMFASVEAALAHGSADQTEPTTVYGKDDDYTKSIVTREADISNMFMGVGLAPFNTVAFKFDQDEDPSTWLDLAANATVDLEVHTRSGSSYADGDAKVVIDRFIPY